MRSWSTQRTAQIYGKWSVLGSFCHCGPLPQDFREIFHNNQFQIDHYKMFRLDRNRYGGSLVLHGNEQVPCKKLTNYENPIASEIIVLEFHQSKRKWLILGIYKAPNQKEAELLQNISWLLDFYNTTY